MKRNKTLIGIIGATIILWIGGLFAFLQNIPKTVDDTLYQTDAIIVLTGGSLRLAKGLELLRNSKAKKLFVSGVHRGVDVQKLLKISRQSPAKTKCCIALGHKADNTQGNAEETAAWMKDQGYSSMRLVTAAYHMPRSVLEFRYTLPKTRIILHPVFPERVKLNRWWFWPGTTGVVLGEYSKYLIAKARHFLTPLWSGQP